MARNAAATVYTGRDLATGTMVAVGDWRSHRSRGISSQTKLIFPRTALAAKLNAMIVGSHSIAGRVRETTM
jgi:hypothetical protein